MELRKNQVAPTEIGLNFLRQKKQKKCICPCGEMFTPTILGQKHINQSHYTRWLSETEAGKKKMAETIEKAKRQTERNIQKRKKEFIKAEKQKDKELKDKTTDWSKKLQDKVQEIVRLIDKGQPCIARGYINCRFHGGHVISRGSGAKLKLNLHNIHRQSAQSNHWQNDDALMKEGIKLEYGLKYFEFIESLKRTPISKYSNDEYKEFYSIACGIVRKLKKDDKEYNLEERISLRNEFNLELGVYHEEFCIYV